MALAARLEQASEHPLARTVVQEATRRGLEIGPVPEQVDVVAGGGITADNAHTAELVANQLGIGINDAPAIATADLGLAMRAGTIIAISTVVLLLAGVLAQRVFMATGMLVHEISVLAVILNAVRLIRFRTSTLASAAPAIDSAATQDTTEGVGVR